MPILRDGLAAYIEQRMKDLNLNSYEVSRRSGGRISHGTVWNIINRRVAEVKDATLEIMAEVLDLSLDEMQARSRLPTAKVDPITEEEFRESALHFLYQRALTADDETKKLIDQTIEMLLDRIDKAAASHADQGSEKTERIPAEK